MTRVLDLTEDQAAKIFPALNRVEKEKMRIQIQITRQMKELRTILKDENLDLKEVEEKVDSLKELRNMIKNKELLNDFDRRRNTPNQAEYRRPGWFE